MKPNCVLLCAAPSEKKVEMAQLNLEPNIQDVDGFYAELLAAHPEDAPAIGAPDRPWLSYGDLRAQADATADALPVGINLGGAEGVSVVVPSDVTDLSKMISVGASSI